MGSNDKPRQNSQGHRDASNYGRPTQPQSLPGVKAYEDRRNGAACFKDGAIDGGARYTGVLVAQDLKDGAKYWVSIKVRRVKSGKRQGETYLSVSLQPFERRVTQ